MSYITVYRVFKISCWRLIDIFCSGIFPLFMKFLDLTAIAGAHTTDAAQWGEVGV